jgi:uncharacterized membrane protein
MSNLLALQEWAATALRWLHVVSSIFWIGAALAFLRLNLALKSRQADIWRAGDDGYFQIARRETIPIDAQPEIGWFRWDSYVAWLSGAGLMIAYYFVDADLYLIDPNVFALTPAWAIGVAVAAIALGWLVYDFLCKAPLGWSETTRRIAIFVFLVATMFGLAHVFSGRGALLTFGAIIGTIMVANVAHVLVPGQRRMLEAVRKGEQPDPLRLAASRQRALHNNYMALPVLFLMLSTHSPLVFASRFNWLIASLALVVGAAIRHFYIARHRGQGDLWWTWGVAAAGLAAMIFMSALGVSEPRAAAAPRDAQSAIASIVAPRFADVEDIVTARCVMCHAHTPVWNGLGAPPKGVRFDDPARIRTLASQIALQAAWTHAMPPGGAEVGMTEAERAIIAAWSKAGAPAH